MVTNSAPQKTWNSRKNHFKIQIQPKEMKNRLLVHHREMSFSRESSFPPLFRNSIKNTLVTKFYCNKKIGFTILRILLGWHSPKNRLLASITSRVQQASQSVLSITDAHRYNSDTLPYFRDVFRGQFIFDSRYVTELLRFLALFGKNLRFRPIHSRSQLWLLWQLFRIHNKLQVAFHCMFSNICFHAMVLGNSTSILPYTFYCDENLAFKMNMIH